MFALHNLVTKTELNLIDNFNKSAIKNLLLPMFEGRELDLESVVKIG